MQDAYTRRNTQEAALIEEHWPTWSTSVAFSDNAGSRGECIRMLLLYLCLQTPERHTLETEWCFLMGWI